ncbi:hypothetical protein GC098_30135 [Paenibacillus sp. LMG 31458]|uniref:MucBP domain-containing protein n=1 Tax=Paenibacillus phytorum TaxID=2654977 RepID=A0ABX1Y687_9BACL|nr:hypothetical protein [Paenibacillus phytorum]NOU75586.1 hypothetical protein [Paenibacillus phytorum]
MIHSYKNYTTIKGIIRSHFDKDTTTVHFQIRQGEKPGAYWLIENKNSNMTKVYDGTYMFQTNIPLFDASVKKPDYNFEKDEIQKSGVPYTIAGLPHPYLLAETVLADSEKWSMEGKEPLLGRTAVVIRAGTDPYSVFPVTGTKLWVDEVTGILLKKAYYTESSELPIIQAEMLELEVNAPLDQEKLSVPHGEVAQYK